LKDFVDEQAKINKVTVTKFKSIDKVLENIDSKVMEVGSSNHQVLNMMKMLETQVGQLAGRLTTNEGKLPGQPKGPESAKAIQTRSRKETKDPERSAGARKPEPSAEAEEFAKEEVTAIITEEPDFEMPEEDTKIPQLKPCYFQGKLDNHFEKFVEVVRRLSINMSLLDALQVPTYLLTDKRRIPLRSASVRTPHLFHHGIPKVLVNPRSKGITSVRSTTTH
jgi:hypothetical protein